MFVRGQFSAFANRMTALAAAWAVTGTILSYHHQTKELHNVLRFSLAQHRPGWVVGSLIVTFGLPASSLDPLFPFIIQKKATISDISQSRSVTPAAIAGVQRNVWRNRTKFVYMKCSEICRYAYGQSALKRRL